MTTKVLYESIVKNEYADHGVVKSSQGKTISIKPTLSKDKGHNPGELFAFSWATCLEATFRYVCHIRHIKTTSYTTVTFKMLTDDGPPKGYQFFYEATIHMDIENEDERESLLQETHLRCPISKLINKKYISLSSVYKKSISS